MINDADLAQKCIDRLVDRIACYQCGNHPEEFEYEFGHGNDDGGGLGFGSFSLDDLREIIRATLEEYRSY